MNDDGEIRTRWVRVISEVLLEEIVREYSSADRHYHTMKHISEVSSLLIEFESILVDFEACMLAALYHDIVYDTRSKENERLSADRCRKDLKATKTNELDAACSLILSTQKHIPLINDIDHRLFLDADLAILGSERHRYSDYMNAIRREYSWVSESDYKKGRTDVLRNFLTRDKIFFTSELGNRFEDPARENLKYELEALAEARF